MDKFLWDEANRDKKKKILEIEEAEREKKGNTTGTRKRRNENTTGTRKTIGVRDKGQIVYGRNGKTME